MKEYLPISKFVYRTPIYPYTKLENIDDTFKSKELFKSLISSSIFQESIYLASPSLFNELHSFLEGNIQQKDEHRFILSILKYYLRMCTRCTPFGIYAGCGIGEVGETTNIILNKREEYQTHTRLDMNYLGSFIQEINSFPTVRNKLLYYPNSSLYVSGDCMRYYENKTENNKNNYTLSSIQVDEYIKKILLLTEGGARINKIEDSFIEEGFTREEINDYLQDLINNQILVSELYPSITGGDLLEHLIDFFNEKELIPDKLRLLQKVKDTLNHIDKLPLGRDLKQYSFIKELIKDIGVSYNEQCLFQTDLLISSQKAEVDDNVTESLKEAIKILNKLTPVSEHTFFTKFKNDYYKRYGSEELPLVAVLDVETGIGFGDNTSLDSDISDFLKDCNFNDTSKDNENLYFSPVSGYLHKKYESYLQDNLQDEIEIREEELLQFKASYNDLPFSLSVMVDIIYGLNNKEELSISINSCGGSTGGYLLGRFCSLDEGISDIVTEINQREDEFYKDKIVAEIIHLPESRAGNILSRPSLRNYEIPILVKPSTISDKTIKITDLMVSVTGQTIRLRSKKHGKEVVPRLTTAHNFFNKTLPIYQFLCLYQTYGLRSSLKFNWGELLLRKEYLPRVRYKNIILSPATWNITFESLQDIPNVRDEKFMVKVSVFWNEKKLPKKVLLVQGDNKLLIDSDHSLSLQLLFSETKGKAFKLEEFFYNDFALAINGSERFTNQTIISFYKNIHEFEKVN